MTLLFTVAFIACIILFWKLNVSSRIIQQLIQASKTSEPVILPEKGFIRGPRGMDALVKEFNALLAEKESITGAGEAYHKQIQTLLGNLREAVVMVDHENLIQSVNPSLMQLIDGQLDTVGKRLDALIQGTDFIQFLREVRTKGFGYAPEIKVRINDAPHWIEISASQLNEASSRSNRYTLFIIQDITRQKQLEKMRTEFVANVSHELRTPVTIIKGFAETLMEDDAVLSAEDKIRFLDKISRNSDRLHRLVEDLMLLTRLESTEMVLQVETFSLNKFLEDFAENLRASGSENIPALVLELAEDVEIHADPLRLSQVLHNLMDNAYRHAKGATKVTLCTEVEPDKINLIVSDNGIGIPEKDLPHIFQRFFRVDKGRSRESGGTGLGLSIVKHIMAQHAGSISATSKVGEGTRIECIFPRDVPARHSAIEQSRQ